MKVRNTKKALLSSALCLLLCFAMLIGSTFAWFTDRVEVTGNRIQAGNLDVEMFYKNAKVTDWANVNTVSEDEPKFFLDVNGQDIKWEPGAVAYATFKVENVGSLALKYTLETIASNFNTVANTDKSLKDVLTVAVPTTVDTSSREALIASIEDATVFESFGFDGKVLEEGKYDEFTVVIYWAPSAVDNDYNLKDGKLSSDGEPLWINLDFALNATQATVEEDSFDEYYDELADATEVATADELNAAIANGGEIALTNDITLGTAPITVAGDVVITLNGNELNAANNASRPFEMADGASLTINGGKDTVKCGAYGLVNILEGSDAEVVLNGGVYEAATDKGSFIKPRGTGKISITLNNVTYTDTSAKNWLIDASSYKGDDMTITVNGGEYNVVHGIIAGRTDITLKGVTLNAKQVGVEVGSDAEILVEDSTITVAGGIFEGNNPSACVAASKGGSAIIKNSTLISDCHILAIYSDGVVASSIVAEGCTITQTATNYDMYKLYTNATGPITVDGVDVA